MYEIRLPYSDGARTRRKFRVDWSFDRVRTIKRRFRYDHTGDVYRRVLPSRIVKNVRMVSSEISLAKHSPFPSPRTNIIDNFKYETSRVTDI